MINESRNEMVLQVGTITSRIVEAEHLAWLFGESFSLPNLDAGKLTRDQIERLLLTVNSYNSTHSVSGRVVTRDHFGNGENKKNDDDSVYRSWMSRHQSAANKYLQEFDAGQEENPARAFDFAELMENNASMKKVMLRGFPDFRSDQLIDTSEGIYDSPRNAIIRCVINKYFKITEQKNISETVGLNLYRHLIKETGVLYTDHRSKQTAWDIASLRSELSSTNIWSDSYQPQFECDGDEIDINGWERHLSNEEWVSYYGKHLFKAKLRVNYLEDSLPYILHKQLNVEQNTDPHGYYDDCCYLFLPRTLEGCEIAEQIVPVELKTTYRSCLSDTEYPSTYHQMAGLPISQMILK